MNKQEKLIELGYKRILHFHMVEYIKYYKKYEFIIEIYFRRNNQIVGYVSNLYGFEKQQDIDELQEAFNILQQDLKELNREEQQ